MKEKNGLKPVPLFLPGRRSIAMQKVVDMIWALHLILIVNATEIQMNRWFTDNYQVCANWRRSFMFKGKGEHTPNRQIESIIIHITKNIYVYNFIAKNGTYKIVDHCLNVKYIRQSLSTCFISAASQIDGGQSNHRHMSFKRLEL